MSALTATAVRPGGATCKRSRPRCPHRVGDHRAGDSPVLLRLAASRGFLEQPPHRFDEHDARPQQRRCLKHAHDFAQGAGRIGSAVAIGPTPVAATTARRIPLCRFVACESIVHRIPFAFASARRPRGHDSRAGRSICMWSSRRDYASESPNGHHPALTAEKTYRRKSNRCDGIVQANLHTTNKTHTIKGEGTYK